MTTLLLSQSLGGTTSFKLSVRIHAALQTLPPLQRHPLSRSTITTLPYRHGTLLRSHQPSFRRDRKSTLRTCAIAATAPTSSPAVALVAVVVGWLVIAGSVFRSVPQIVRIFKNKSAVGLSLTAIICELAVYTITVAYNVRFQYPFSTWGDTFMVLLQQIIIVAMVFKFNKAIPVSAKVAAPLGLLASCAFLFTDICNVKTLQFLQACSALLLAFGGRLPQILLNWKRGNSGELSGLSVGLSVAGNLARVFTTITLVGDYIILASAATQLVLNSVLLFQILETVRREKAAVVAAAAV